MFVKELRNSAQVFWHVSKNSSITLELKEMWSEFQCHFQMEIFILTLLIFSFTPINTILNIISIYIPVNFNFQVINLIYFGIFSKLVTLNYLSNQISVYSVANDPNELNKSKNTQ